MSGPQRRALEGMVSLDRVGVGAVVPVCIGGLEPPTVRRSLLRTAGRHDIPAAPCENQASDHWSFDKAGLPAARIGSTPYAEYHSAADRPRVVSTRQLDRVGRLMWAWLEPGR
jgi:Peptidase family M28